MSKSNSIPLTHSRLKELFSYDPISGVFTRIKNHSNIKSGTVAGTVRHDGYVTIFIDWKRYLVHRLAWLYVHEKWPDDILDHIDGNPTNNAITNLREASYTQNGQNRKKHNNKSGYKGVCKNHNRWSPFISINGKTKYLGCFATPEEAYQEYCRVAKELHGDFYREI